MRLLSIESNAFKIYVRIPYSKVYILHIYICVSNSLFYYNFNHQHDYIFMNYDENLHWK
jgi:hypothetical protein